MQKRGVWLLIFFLIMSIASAQTPYFQDSFETGDNSHTENGFTWNGGDNRVVTDHAYTGNHSQRYRYGPDAPGEDSSAEQRFTITPNATSAPTETWIQYMLYIPNNFKHRDDTGADNNKFMTLWAERYSDPEEAQFYLSMERTNDDSQSRLKFIAVHGDDSRYPGGAQNIVTNQGLFPTSEYHGKWVRIRIHARLATNGELQIWADDNLISSVTNYNMVYADYDWNYYRHGYLFGWSNSGYTEQTDFYIDDFKLWTIDPQWTFS